MANVPLIAEPNYASGGLSFLQMVQRLRQESGMSGSAPATVVSQTGDIKSLVDWVSTAWMDIQNERPDWFFMRQDISFSTIATQQSYTAAQAGVASFGNFKVDSFRQYRVSAGYASEFELEYMPYDVFRNAHLFSAMRSRTQLPLNFTLDPSKNFVIGPIPDDVYNINGEGYAMPTEMALDADRPTLPPQYHMMIVWRALMYYGQKEAAPEAYSHGQNEYDRLMRKLVRDQLPSITIGSALC
jgi:hypothetical protein